ncbi:MAG: hypothetical protein SF028_01100 [Candidatus Sumerlaeia bacterium]|nr:hypothetical protein [Candidatus Sumerlaeia bacterium]
MLRTAATFAAALALAAATQAEGLLDAVPPNAFMVGWVEDVPSLGERFDASAIGKVYRMDEMADFRRVLSEKTAEARREAEEELGVPLDEIVSAAGGDVVFFLTTGADGAPATGATLIELVPESAATIERMVERAVAEMPADAQRSTYTVGPFEVMSFKYYEDEPDPATPGAFIQRARNAEIMRGPALLAFGAAEGDASALREPLARLSGGDDSPSYFATPEYRALLELHGGETGDINFVGDPVPGFEDSVRETPGGEENMRKVRAALGLPDRLPIFVSFRMRPDGSDFATTLHGGSGDGFLGLFRKFGRNPLSTMSRVPYEANSYTTWMLDGAELMRELRAILLLAQPQALGIMNLVLDGQKQSLGVDIENEVIANLSGEHFSYTLPLDPSEREEILANPVEGSFTVLRKTGARLATRNSSAFNSSVDRALTQLIDNPQGGIPFDRTEEQSVPVFEFKGAPGADNPLPARIALAPQAVLVTFDGAMMQEALRGETTPPARSIADRPELQRLLPLLDRESAFYFSFSTEEAWLLAIETNLAMFKQTVTDPEALELLQALPPVSALRGKLGDAVGMWSTPEGAHRFEVKARLR